MRERIHDLIGALASLKREAKRAYAEASRVMDDAAVQLGLPQPSKQRSRADQVIDVGAPPPSRAKETVQRAARAVGSAVALGLAVSAMVSLAAFCAQIFLAFLLVTRGLGLRVDVGAPSRGAA